MRDTRWVCIFVLDNRYLDLHDNSIPFEQFGSFQEIHEYLEEHNKVLVFLAKSTHKIKKKAEQTACEEAIAKIEN